MPGINDRATRELRKTEAVARQTDAKNRTPEIQIALLDDRLGTDVGAAKERARLATQFVNA